MKEYNVQQISKLLQTNPETVRRWIRTGKLKAVHLIGEIERCEKSVAQKKKTIEQLQKEVQNDEKQIETYKYALTHLDLESLANEINNTLK